MIENLGLGGKGGKLQFFGILFCGVFCGCVFWGVDTEKSKQITVFSGKLCKN